MVLTRIVLMILRIIDAYSLVLTVYALLSWFPQAYQSRLGQFISALSEPFVNYFRRIRVGMFSFSVVFALLFLQFVRYGVIAIYRMLG